MTSTPERTLGWEEFSDCVGDGFLGSAAKKNDMLNAALGADARPAVFAAINRLPDRDFRTPQEAWRVLDAQ